MLCCVAAARSPFGRLVLVSGPEALFADRAVAALLLQMRSEAPDVEISEIEAARLDRRQACRDHRALAVLQPSGRRHHELENLSSRFDVRSG